LVQLESALTRRNLMQICNFLRTFPTSGGDSR